MMKLIIKNLTLFVVLFLFITKVNAVETINLVGFFPGKAVVTIDGKQYVIKKGQLKKGVRYLRKDGDNAELEVDGVKSVFKMGAPVSLNFSKKSVNRKVIYADRRGMFRTVGSINGQSINFLVDTGATSVAMSSHHAKKLNIRYRLDGKETTARTASGIARAYYLKLKTVKVGEITKRNVDGLIIVGAYPKQVLLGMSFLNQVKVQTKGDAMMLESH